MTQTLHSFAARLRGLRDQRRLSKTALANSVGVSTTCVWNWEEGNTEPRSENLASLSKVLGVTADYLEFGDRGFGSPDEDIDNSTLVTPETLPEVIASAKLKIANLAGIDPSKVKISLDY